MEDILKVVLHTPSVDIACNKYENDEFSQEQFDAYCKLTWEDYRLTLVAVVDREEFRVGVSICNTRTDNFNKKKGIEIATMRALTTPIYNATFEVQPDKFEVLDKLKELHMEVGSNLKAYKRIVHGV